MSTGLKEKIRRIMVEEKTTIKEAIKLLNDNSPILVLLVVDENKKLLGTVTDGDIRRGLLKDVGLFEPLLKVMNDEPKFLFSSERDKAKEFMKEHSITLVPLLNAKEEVTDVVLWGDLGDEEFSGEYLAKDSTVFILAGGQGKRLDPFTKILPKPLMPIGDKPILELIMEKYKKYGFINFTLALNYKAEMIKAYFNNKFDDIFVDYVEEKEFLGTAGSLKLAKEKLKKTFVVTNCDVIIDIDYDDAYRYHIRSENDATVVGVVRHVKIPYGILEMENGKLTDISEKPEYDFVVNAGIYILEPKMIDLICNNESVDMPDLLLRAKKNGFKVGVYPISNAWVDIGQPEEYKQALDHFSKMGYFNVIE